MTDFVRRLVSGNKARYKDEELDLELDLAYITDRIIVMGYPSKGLEGLYRNRREDAKKFLDHRHSNNYWVFNFCPVVENEYPAEVFDGRVSRYPFPDHQLLEKGLGDAFHYHHPLNLRGIGWMRRWIAPPLAILPLIAREMRVWLDGSPDRVAVLHCKAGKGRSGTMACSYLLAETDLPRPPSSGRSRSAEEAAKQQAEDLMNAMPADVDASVNSEGQTESPANLDDPIKHELSSDPEGANGEKKSAVSRASTTKSANTLEHVLSLHTAGRMKRPSSPSEKVKQGVSIPSQRRWLYYWSLVIARQSPPGFWSLNAAEREPSPKVRLTNMKLRMRELSGVKANLIKAANILIDKTGKGKAVPDSKSQVWASLARYDDELVDTLEYWERVTRADDGNMGSRKPGSEHQDDGELKEIFVDAKWDAGKMVRSFARLGTLGGDGVTKEADGKTLVHTLRPLSGDRWAAIKSRIQDGTVAAGAANPAVESEEASIHDATGVLPTADGVVLNANREVRVKLYIGQVFMGWFWFIPTFHMTHPRSAAREPTQLRLTRKEVDFPLGVGSHIIDLEVTMEWCEREADVISPPPRQDSADSAEGKGDPSGLATALGAATIGQPGQVVDAAQAGSQ